MFSWLSSFSLGTPLFLVGALAGLIPIIIHMIYTRKAPIILFSTVRFLKIATRKTARRRRVEDLLLMIFRILLFSLLAVALAQPFFRSGGIFGANAAVNAAIVLDNSMSMATEQERQPRYAKAKEITQGIIRSLPPGSAVAVIYSYAPHRKVEAADQAKGAAPVSFGETFSHDTQSVYEAVSASDASPGRGDVAAAVRKAYELIAKINEPNREIYVITDLQKAAWASAVEKLGDDKTKDVPVFVIDCSSGSFKNVAVSSAEIKARAAVVGSPVTVDATIVNSSSQTQSDLPVAFYVDKTKRTQKVVTIPAQGNVTASFGYVFDAAGQHTGWVEAVTNDSLLMDNKRSFSIHIEERIPVALVKEGDTALPFMSEEFYLSRALDPFAGTSEADKGTVSIKEIPHSGLAKTDLDPLRILFLLNLKDLTPPEEEKVRAYLLGGGNVVIFPGDQLDIKGYERLESGKPPLLPAHLFRATGDPEERSHYMPLSKIDTTHPIFQPMADVPNSALRSVHMYRYYELQIKPGMPGKALAKLADGRPFLVEGAVGKGKVLFFCTSAGASWSNLPVRNLFLPMIQQIVYYLAGGGERRVDHIVGSPVELMPRTSAKPFTLEVTDPLGQTRRVEPSAKGAEVSFVYTDTDSLGTYSWQTDEKPPQTGIFVVNHDPQESDLSEYHQDDLASLFTTTKVYFAPDIQHLDKDVTDLRQGFQLWNYLLLIVLGIAIVECILANKKKSPAQAAATGLSAMPGSTS
jgi:hypothetical protein